MRINNKIMLSLLILCSLFFFITYTIGHEYLMESIIKFENDNINQNINRVNQAITQNKSSLNSYTTDWAHWNDAYDYVAGTNPAFIKNNWFIDSFINAKINLIIYFDKSGKILMGNGVDDVNKTLTPIPKSLYPYLFNKSPLVYRPNVNDDLSGFIYLDSGLLMVSASGMSYGDKSKPVNGTLLTGRYLSNALVEKISKTTELNLRLYLLPEIKSSLEMNNIFKEMSQSRKNVIQKLNSSTAYGYTLIVDVFDKPVAILRITLRRTIFLTGQSAIDYYQAASLVASMLLVIIIAGIVRFFVVKPLENLSKQIKKISIDENYNIQLFSKSNDELSYVTSQINAMMKKIQTSNDKLLMSARKAGMSDVATSVLHNIGNVMNSINVATDQLNENMKKSDFSNLLAVSSLLNENKHNIYSYLTQDEKGKLLPSYIIAVVEELARQREKDKKEIASLINSYHHIEDIVLMQKSISGSSTLIQKVLIKDLIEKSVQICGNLIFKNHIEIKYDIDDSLVVESDQAKLMQIIINLLHNARDAIMAVEVSKQPRLILIGARLERDKPAVVITVTDNGCGILTENLSKIFLFGFTTKEGGHGFGLHSCAIIAKELGGSLVAISEGDGCGATFVLTLPLAF